jgi:hypothetical protein
MLLKKHPQVKKKNKREGSVKGAFSLHKAPKCFPPKIKNLMLKGRVEANKENGFSISGV